MDRLPPSDVKVLVNEPRELLARLYREIGVSAVAAALAPERLAAEDATTSAPQVLTMVDKVAA